MNDSLLFDADESQFSWLLQHFPTIPHFQRVKSGAIFALRAALQVETQPIAVAAYIRFLATCALDEPLPFLAELCFVRVQSYLRYCLIKFYSFHRIWVLF